VRLEWVIEPKDVAKVKDLVKRSAKDPFVQRRRQRNLGGLRPKVSRATAWKVMVGCLLTTQQKSGPGRPIERFLNSAPFPLAYGSCRGHAQLEKRVLRTLSAFGGIRRSTTIATQLAANLRRLEDGHWNTLLAVAKRVEAGDDFKVERAAAHYVADTFDGFGPKQSRNLFQWLGVSKYEIPVDSRITKWLNRELLALRLNANLLADAQYYDIVSDGIIELCRAARVTPCIFDAAVFSSFDRAGWPDSDLAAASLSGA
jgi:hypothetical protein